jgi:hypothetical protein
MKYDIRRDRLNHEARYLPPVFLTLPVQKVQHCTQLRVQHAQSQNVLDR